MKSWATTDTSKSGKAHLWREAASNPLVSLSECGRMEKSTSLQAPGEEIGQCKKCAASRFAPTFGRSA